MHLPDYTDRVLVGSAAGLSDDQIKEISKLEKGVAVVSQSDWLEAVLCKIDKFETISEYSPRINRNNYPIENHDNVKEKLLYAIMNPELFNRIDEVEWSTLKDNILRSKLSSSIKAEAIRCFQSKEDSFITALRIFAYDFLNAKDAFYKAAGQKDVFQWVKVYVDSLNPSIKDYSKTQINALVSLLLYEQQVRDASCVDLFCRFAEIYEVQGGVY